MERWDSLPRARRHVVAPIELKGASQSLDHARGRLLTPVQQGWDYANKVAESRWIIVSNYRETRLYAKRRDQSADELFLLEELGDEEGFRRFVAILGRDALLGGPTPEQSPLAEMLVASEHAEREITTKLYEQYRTTRAKLFDELRRTHSNIPAAQLLSHAQKTLDRSPFVAFAEDRGLLPEHTLARAVAYRDPYHPRPVWQNFVAVFRSVDTGNAGLQIPAYNGGLFAEDSALDALEVSDEACGWFKELGEYDFRDDVSVDVLGHVFEQSISDLEELRAEAKATDEDLPAPERRKQRPPSQRNREGIFYTPPFVTNFLVRETIGRTLAEAMDRASAGRPATRAGKVATWEAYQDELRRLRNLDPACGSGAFLVAAFDVIAREHDRINRALAELRGPQMQIQDLTRAVLNENLFGVDRSGESIEITKLSLWLKTAEYGRKLTFLDRNVRHGNSVVDDPLLDPWAFDWKVGRLARSFLEPDAPVEENAPAIEARWRDGFDIVIGNPPYAYVRQELLGEYEEHWRASFESFDGMADLFVYFFERGLSSLRDGGRLGFIVSNKWLRGGYAERLRTRFARTCTIETIVDFGHAPVFPDVDAFPCIVTMRKAPPPEKHAVRVTQYPREELGKDLLASYVDEHAFSLPQEDLSNEGWTLEPPAARALLAKLRRNGVSLAEYAGTKPYRGVVTGLNEAFLVDRATKERLCREDPRSAEVLKKYLRGQDVARWAPQWAGLWMIYAPWDFDIGSFPAIEKHLMAHRDALAARPEVKQGRFFWYAMSRYASEYVSLFDAPKIVYQVIQFHPAYCLDTDGYYTNDKAFFLPSADPWLLAVLNSPAMWWHNWRFLVHLEDEALTPSARRWSTSPALAREGQKAGGSGRACPEGARQQPDATRAPRAVHRST